MNFIWPLVAMPAFGLLYTAILIVRNKPDLPDCVTPLPVRPRDSLKAPESFRGSRREIKWISTKEFGDIDFQSDDVLFIDLRSPDDSKPLPRSAKHVLFITPNRLVDVLRWLPPETSVVLCGASDLCKSLVWSIPNLAGAAPVYVFTDDPVHSEVA